MKKLNMVLAVSTLFSLVTFTGCGSETSSSTNRVSSSSSNVISNVISSTTPNITVKTVSS